MPCTLIHRINQVILNNNGLSGDVLERRKVTREHYKELFFLKDTNSLNRLPKNHGLLYEKYILK